MHEDRTKIIFGPPGTGKTTWLIDMADQLIQGGIPTEGILYLAFTRSAAREAASRAMRKFKKPIEDFPWFRTIHSLAFTQLGLKPRQVMNGFDYSRVAKRAALRLSTRWSVDGNVTYAGVTPDDKIVALEAEARTRDIPLKDMWKLSNDADIKYGMLLDFADKLKTYKSEQQKLDFVDILQRFVRDGAVPPHLVLIVDEAQDLSPVQWALVEKLGETSKRVFIAGDDDQAIYQWAGADAKRLLQLSGERVVLPKSYRVPSNIKGFAMGILGRIKGERVEKQWDPVRTGGEVVRVADVSNAPLDKGKWLILCRNLYTVEQMAMYCYGQGLLFESQSEGPEFITRAMVQAVNAWQKLRQGGTITVQDAITIYGHMSPRSGYTKGGKSALEREDPDDVIDYGELNHVYGLLRKQGTHWENALDRLSVETINKLRSLRMDASSGTLPEPAIRISTIHAAKGLEEDNVLISPDMARRTYEGFLADPDPEHRVWYVGVTRAKQALYVMQPQTMTHYEL